MNNSQKPTRSCRTILVIASLVCALVSISSHAKGQKRAKKPTQTFKLSPDFKRALASGKLKSLSSLSKVERAALMYSMSSEIPPFVLSDKERESVWTIAMQPSGYMHLLCDILSDKEREEFLWLVKTLPSLYGVKELTDSKARELAKFKGDALILNGLTRLTDAQAKALARFKGRSLLLNGLKKLTDAQAEALARFKGRSLSLNGLKELTDAQAKALAGIKGWLDLKGLDEESKKKLEAYRKGKK